VLRGIPQDQLDRMTTQAQAFGSAELSRSADVVNAALSEMTGATSPRLHLELMAARILVPSSDETDRGALARVERLERRIGVEGMTPAAAAPPVPHRGDSADAPPPPVRPAAVAENLRTPAPSAEPAAAATAATATAAPKATAAAPAATANTPEPAAPAPTDAEAPEPDAPEPATPEPANPTAPVTIRQVIDAWPEILEVIENAKRTAWMVVATAKPLELRDGNVLVISFPSQNDVVALKQQSAPGEGVGDHLKKAMVQVLGIEPLLIARVAETAETRAAETKAAETKAAETRAAETKAADARPTDAASPPATSSGGWTVAKIPGSSTPEPAPVVDINSTPASRAAAQRAATPADAPAHRPETTAPAPAEPAHEPHTEDAPPSEPAEAPASRTKAAPPAPSKYGESVVRDVLGATFIEEQPFTPRVIPRDE